MTEEKHPIWEETWVEIDGVVGIEQRSKHYAAVEERFDWEQGVNVGAFGDMSASSPFNPASRDMLRAKVASVAPEALRALKAIEWACTTDPTGWPCCPFCGGQKEGPGCVVNSIWSGICGFGTKSCNAPHDLVGHQPGCEFVRIMMKAGAPELIDEGSHG